jgi:hypothetical protein
MGTDKQNTRDRVIDFFLFLSSEECLNACRGLDSWEKLAYELARVWFNEIYTPGIGYINSLKGDFSPEKAQAFQDCFTEEEMESLERFHRFFELRMDMLPESAKRQEIFPENDAWHHVMRHACYLAEELEPDAEKRRNRLEKYIRRVLTKNDRLPEARESIHLLAPGEASKER